MSAAALQVPNPPQVAGSTDDSPSHVALARQYIEKHFERDNKFNEARGEISFFPIDQKTYEILQWGKKITRCRVGPLVWIGIKLLFRDGDLTCVYPDRPYIMVERKAGDKQHIHKLVMAGSFTELDAKAVTAKIKELKSTHKCGDYGFFSIEHVPKQLISAVIIDER